MSYLSLAEFKAQLGITDNSQDALLTKSLSLANTVINGYLNWDPTDVETDRVYTTVADNGARMLQLPVYPVLSVESITNNGDLVPNNPANGYWLDGTHGIIEDIALLGGVGRNARAGNRVTVIYRAGYSPVPQELKDVAGNIAASIFSNGGEINAPTGGGGTGELKSLTMFDAMSMSFDVGGSTTGESTGGPMGLVSAWDFVLKKYRIGQPVLA